MNVFHRVGKVCLKRWKISFIFSLPLYLFMSWMLFCGKKISFSSPLCPFWHDVFSAIFPALLISQNSHIITQKKAKQRYQALIWDVQINNSIGEIKVRGSMHKQASICHSTKVWDFSIRVDSCSRHASRPLNTNCLGKLMVACASYPAWWCFCPWAFFSTLMEPSA